VYGVLFIQNVFVGVSISAVAASIADVFEG